MKVSPLKKTEYALHNPLYEIYYDGEEYDIEFNTLEDAEDAIPQFFKDGYHEVAIVEVQNFLISHRRTYYNEGLDNAKEK